MNAQKCYEIYQEKKRRHFYEQHLHNEATVLFEQDVEDGFMHGIHRKLYFVFRQNTIPFSSMKLKTIRLNSINSKGQVEVIEPEFEAVVLSH